MKRKINITVFCRDKEVFVQSDRLFGWLADAILEDDKIQQECNRKVERVRRKR